jgi:hypothetical protein
MGIILSLDRGASCMFAASIERFESILLLFFEVIAAYPQF